MIIKESSLTIVESPFRSESIESLMTPKEILDQEEFEKPLIIRPKEFLSFDDLLSCKDEIQTLKLVPIKNDEIHDHYNSLDKKDLHEEIKSYFDPESDMVLAPNLYPYWLPKDCEQKIVWVGNRIREEFLINFIGKCVHLSSTSPEEIILFERPANITTKLVKGTFPELRHIHFWKRK